MDSVEPALRLSRPGDLTVLIVEDEPKLRVLLQGVVADLGFAVVVAASAEAAQKLLVDHPVQIVLSDMNLPGKSGLEMLSQMRQHGWAGQAIVISAFGSFSAAQQAIKLDVCEFLSKPFDLSQVEQALDRARSRLSTSCPQPVAPTEQSAVDSVKPLEQVERELIERTLVQFDGNRSKTARVLGISRRTLYNKLKPS